MALAIASLITVRSAISKTGHSKLVTRIGLKKKKKKELVTPPTSNGNGLGVGVHQNNLL